MYTNQQAKLNPTEFKFSTKSGFTHEGAPKLPQRAFGAEVDALPPSSAHHGTWHHLRASQGPLVRMQWVADPAGVRKGLWQAPLGSPSERMAYTAAYLAAWGWTYSGVA